MGQQLAEIITLITGVIYIILEIRQKNAMWVLGIFTSIAGIIVFFQQGLYASLGLNIYYLITSFIGLWHWRNDKKKLDEEHSIHLNRLTAKTVIISAVVSVAGIAALSFGMRIMAELGFKENPMSVLDASVAILSVIATWWLVRSYIQQWWLWIAADTLSTILCISQGLWWMAVLYILYTGSAVIGLRHWKKNGATISATKE